MRPHSFTSLSLLACAAALTCMSVMHTASAQTVFDYAGKWTFDDCSATNVLRDTSGNNATAVRGSSVVCVPDQLGRPNSAVALVISQPGNGTAATTVRITNAPSFAPLSTNMAFSAKIMPGAVPQGAILTKMWSEADGTVRRTFQLSIVRDAAGNSRLLLDLLLKNPRGTAPVPVHIQSSQVIPPSKWTQVGASFDPDNGMQVFVNGQSDGPFKLNATIYDAPVGTFTTTFIGGGNPQQTVGYTGFVDDVWIAKAGCADLQSSVAVIPNKELMITKLDVVNDPVRTVGKGAWTFGRLMEQMVPASASDPTVAVNAAADMVENMFKSYDTDQLINKQTIKRREAANNNNVNTLVLNSWPRLPNGKLDLAQSPLRLLAIVNRMDLRSLTRGDAGEGRFIYGVLNPNGSISQFTVILEYRLPASTAADIRIWARDWHALGTQTLDTAAYNTALQAITDRFTTRGAFPTRVNGSAIGQVRTNEIAMGGIWELRQFELQASGSVSTLVPSPVAMTPAEVFKSQPGFVGTFINENASAIVDGTFTVPLAPKIGGVQVSFFQGGSALVSGIPWDGTDIQPFTSPTTSVTTSASDMRHTFALNTCSGCHLDETSTGFLHVSPRAAGVESRLSGFLKGIAGVPDAMDPTAPPRSFNDLERRRLDMNAKLLACPAPGALTPLTGARMAITTSATSMTSTSTTTTTTTTPQTSLTQGISRVH